MKSKPRLVSGIQPTGKLHIGNYVGALKNFVALQDSGKYECFFFIADLHSMTEYFTPKEKTKQIEDVALSYLAAGLDPKKSTLFLQSDIPEHTELAWILNTITPIGELERMTQFKEKAHINFDIVKKLNEYYKKSIKIDKEIVSYLEPLNTVIKELLNKDKREENIKIVSDLMNHYEKSIKPEHEAHRKIVEDDALSIIYLLAETIDKKVITNAGLLTYPILMAADIILYDAHAVPVGEDQLQHTELTRTLARKFNARFGKTFHEPKPLLAEVPRLMSLDDPLKKMSKSRPAGCLFLDDDPIEIRNKIKRAVTDSGRDIVCDPVNKPAVSNLLLLYSSIAGVPISDLEKRYAEKGYAEFKADLAEIVVAALLPFQKRKKALKKNAVRKMLLAGGMHAQKIARKKMEEVRKKTGITL